MSLNFVDLAVSKTNIEASTKEYEKQNGYLQFHFGKDCVWLEHWVSFLLITLNEKELKITS